MFKVGDIIERHITDGKPNAGERLLYYVLDGTPVDWGDRGRVATLPILHPPSYFAPANCDPGHKTNHVKPVYPAVRGSRLITGIEAYRWRRVGESLMIRLRLEGRWAWTSPL